MDLRCGLGDRLGAKMRSSTSNGSEGQGRLLLSTAVVQACDYICTYVLSCNSVTRNVHTHQYYFNLKYVGRPIPFSFYIHSTSFMLSNVTHLSNTNHLLASLSHSAHQTLIPQVTHHHTTLAAAHTHIHTPTPALTPALTPVPMPLLLRAAFRFCLTCFFSWATSISKSLFRCDRVRARGWSTRGQ